MSRMALKKSPATLVDEYEVAKDNEKAIKSQVSELNKQLKDIMLEGKLNKLGGTNVDVTLSTTQKESFNEEKAIEILKETLNNTQLKQVVRTKEYIDDDALEKLVYNGKFDMSKLECCRTLTPVHTLRISKKKEK